MHIRYQLVDSGLSILPILRGRKSPAIASWTDLQSRLPTKEELDSWGSNEAWAIICGKVSGGLEVIDFDVKNGEGVFEEWKSILPPEALSVLETLPLHTTRNKGFHVFYKCKKIEGNLKLARGPKIEYKIETRGEGGLILIPPSEGYEEISGSILSIPEISPEIRDIFINCALSLTEDIAPERRVILSPKHTDGTRPGDEFIERSTWDEILIPHGWKRGRQKEEMVFWERPGKNEGSVSASSDYHGKEAHKSGMFFVFSTSCYPLEAGRAYNKFSLHAILNFNSDFKAAAKDLASKGFGKQSIPYKKTPVDGEELELIRASDVKTKPIEWLWEDMFPIGKVSVIAGRPGLGKSQISLSMASTISNGGLFPGTNKFAKIGSTIFLSSEDDPEDTVVPRLNALDADVKKIYIAAMVKVTAQNGTEKERALDLAEDIFLIEKRLQSLGDARMVVIDPVTEYLGKTDSNNNAEMRALLSMLSKLARKYKIAVVAVTHLNKGGKDKGQDVDPMERISGSIALPAVARVAYLVIRDKDNKDKRLMLPAKNNLAEDTKGFAYKIEGTLVNDESNAPTIRTSKIVWESEPISTSIESAMQPQKEMSKSEKAQDFLLSILESKPDGMPFVQLLTLAEFEGFSESTLRLAKRALGDAITIERQQNNESRIWKKN